MRRRIKILAVGLPAQPQQEIEVRRQELGWRFEPAASVEECLCRIEQEECDVLLVGCSLAGASVAELLETCLRLRPALLSVFVTLEPDPEEAFRLAGVGLFDYIPVDPGDPNCTDRIVDRIQQAAKMRLPPVLNQDRAAGQACGLIGSSKAMQEVIQLVNLIAPRQSTVLIAGRTGTGKELVASAIHRGSPRARQPFVVINCGAIPENLMEAELFGHTRGAFTGAVQQRQGRFEAANRGTIFLDEMAELPLEMQAKLLRALQEREFHRIGSSETIKVDVRVIAATNRDLKTMVQHGTFREDLYYRLNVVPIHLPSLAERVEDIPLLVDHLLQRICSREKLALKRAGREALARLTEYAWPGNVRQLENALEKAVALSGEREVLYPSDFPLPSSPLRRPDSLVPEVKLPPSGLDFDSVVGEIERSLLDQALKRCGGNKKRAADLLRIKRTTFAARWRSFQQSDHLSPD